MARSALQLAGCALLLAACGNHAAPAGAGASASARQGPVVPATPVQPGAAGALAPSNPLGLPAAKINLDAGKRVFTFTEQMMASAKPGATMMLSAATVAGIEGDDLIIEAHGGGASYKVHPGYVIPVPDVPRLRLGDPVLTEHGGLMKHARVVRFVKDRVAVRFTDLDARTPEALLLPSNGAPTSPGFAKAARFVRQVEGLAPGNYAALRQGSDWLHVLLVSGSGEGEARRWLALGFGGAAMIVAEADLKPIPVRYVAKLGSVVWAEWSGQMRRATVQGVDEPGLFTVKYDRAGRPAVVGWGMVMAPLAAEPSSW